MDTTRASNDIIIFYSREAGWSANDLATNGICHVEFLLAMNDFSGMTWAMDISSYFILPEEGIQKEKTMPSSGILNATHRKGRKFQALELSIARKIQS